MTYQTKKSKINNFLSSKIGKYATITAVVAGTVFEASNCYQSLVQYNLENQAELINETFNTAGLEKLLENTKQK